jgi:two-component sensor histidine kinase
MSLVEQPAVRPGSAHDSLELRLEQQRLLDAAARIAADGLEVGFAKVLEHEPATGTLLLRAGVGWREGEVGNNRTPADEQNPAGYSFRTGEAVIANQHAPEQRFRTLSLMAEHGISRALNVPIDIDGTRFGVLEADAREDDRFVTQDIAFLTSLANLVGLALGRLQAEQALERAHHHQQLLTREVSHRVKNSLAMVVALLGLRARDIDDPELAGILADMQARIHTIARAHDLLWRGDRVGMVPLDAMICELAEELVQQSPGHNLRCRIAPLEIDADTAIPLGLMVTELVTNALKYAYDDDGGDILVEIGEEGGQLSVGVSDEGRGLPAGTCFDGKGDATLGARIIASTVRQLRGTLSVEPAAAGTAIRFVMPLPGLTG